jgi:hypothetical protein
VQPRGIDRRETLGRRIVRERRREVVPILTERRSGAERRSGVARRSGKERRSLRDARWSWQG